MNQSPILFDLASDLTGAHAIEVAVLLGDSVVDVKHLQKARRGKTSYVWFGIGAGLMLLSLIGFGTGIANASYNRKSHHQWIEVEHKAERDWRPRRISLGFDFMAFGGLVGSIGCFLYGLVGYRREKDSSPFYKIGSGPDVDFPTDSVHATSFPLVGPVGDDFAFTFQSNMDGEMTMDGQSVRLVDLSSSGRARPSSNAPGAIEVPIPLRARFRVQVGNQTFLVSSVPAPRTYPVPLFAAVSTAFLGVLAATAVIMFGGVGLLQQLAPDPHSFADDLVGMDELSILTQIKPTEDPALERNVSSGESAASAGAKMPLPSGAAGKPEVEQKERQLQRKRRDTFSQDIPTASKAGFLPALDTQFVHATTAMTSTKDFISGIDVRDIAGGMNDGEIGEQTGAWGMSTRGFGPGADGKDWGSIGVTGYGLVGKSHGRGIEFAKGGGPEGRLRRNGVTPAVQIKPVTSVGGLDPAIIRRYVLSKKPSISHCYERKLQVRQDLQGTVVVSFQISPVGIVRNIRAAGLGDREVEDCIAEVISTVQFPTPAAGGYVNVTSFPFILNPVGG